MEPLEAFVTEISNMVADGEVVDGEEYEMENDEAFEALNGLIHEARRILGC